MDEQSMQIFVQEQIMKLTTFGGARDEDVLHWLQDTECIFDQVQLQSSNKYLAIQSYLGDAPLKWFRFNKSNIPDWSSFKIAIVQAYQPSLNSTLFKVKQQPAVNHHNFSSAIDPNGSNSNERFPPSPEIETSTTPEPVINDDQHLIVVIVPELSSPYQLVNQNLIDNPIVDNITHDLSSTTTSISSPSLFTAVVDITFVHEDELEKVQSDEISSSSFNVVYMLDSEPISIIKSVQNDDQVNNSHANVSAHVFPDFICSNVLAR
ncbi:unnamed protein product, partial [Rotaria socialis]